MAWAYVVASGMGSLVFIDEVTADRSRTMKSEVYRNLLSAQIKPNASKLARRNDLKHSARAT